jgi:hypothetical protein
MLVLDKAFEKTLYRPRLPSKVIVNLGIDKQGLA